MKKGWKGESARHSLAARGFKTRPRMPPQYVRNNPFSYLSKKKNDDATKYTLSLIRKDWDEIFPLAGRGLNGWYGDDLWNYVEKLVDKVSKEYPSTGASDTVSREEVWVYIMKSAGTYNKWKNQRRIQRLLGGRK